MRSFRPLISIFCVFLITIAPISAQTAAPSDTNHGNGFISRITHSYRPQTVGPVNLSNSSRLDSLLRAGRLYLSLQDTIALALENNLDIELQRYGAQVAEASILRAKAGGLLRGVTTGVTQGPSSAPTQAGQATGISTSAAAAAAANTSGTVISQTGTTIPNLDPVVTAFSRWGHATNPQTSTFVSGTNTLVTTSTLANFSVSQGFVTGTTATLGFNNQRLNSTSLRSELNPSTATTLSLNITQHLLQGFGVAVNARNIHIAKNNREVSDLQFKSQVINIVAAIINLYWDLVSFGEDVKVKQQAVDLNEKLLGDNRKQVEIGTLAPIEIVRAEAELASAQQDLTISQTRVLQQETILKNALSRNGVASPSVAEARIVPTDRIQVPQTEAIQPIQDMMAEALRARPELSQRRIQLVNDQISLRGSRSQLLPTVDIVANVANNGLTGVVSALPLPEGAQPRSVTPFFVGGYGNVLSQVFGRNFPDYNIGFQLNIPLRNRAAQADMLLDQLTVRQREISIQQLENQVRVDVQNALIALQQSRATYLAANKTRVFREQTLDAEQKKYALGASTIFNVILVQRDLAQAQSAEVNALSAYSRARVQIDTATGQTLNNNNISVSEAFRGAVARPAAPLPPE
jgi:outer membrane protein